MKDKAIIAIGTALTAVCLFLVLWEPQVHTATLGDGDIRYKLAGEGTPTVICEAGLGMDLESFDPVFGDIAEHTRVFSYDRPGYGESTTTARSRSVEQAVDDLRSLLRLTGVEPPYILVGHSLGGLYMLDFAHRFPTETAGVVLVDAPHPDLFSRLEELGEELKIPDKFYWSMPEYARREFDGALAGSLGGSIGDTPLIVMTSGDAANDVLGPMVRRMRKELLELSTNSRPVFAEDSSHMMLDDVPELVVESVLDILQQVRAK